jgi:hypothetical protein
MGTPLGIVPDHLPGKRPDRIEYLRVKNYRALCDVEFKNLTPLTVLHGLRCICFSVRVLRVRTAARLGSQGSGEGIENTGRRRPGGY